MNSHDTEMVRLYEEMEQQIKVEKEKVHQQVRILPTVLHVCWNLKEIFVPLTFISI